MDLRLQTGYRQIFAMAFPISLALFVPQINFITNNIFLGGLGEMQLASAGITGVYYLVFAVIGNGLNNGLQALISRRAGQNQKNEIGKLFYHGIFIALAIAFFGILFTYVFAPSILRATIHNPLIATEVIDFLLIRILGLPLLYLYIMRNALLIGTNHAQWLIWGTLAETLTNIFLDYALIYGHFGFPRIGFNGAAYASIIAEGMGLLVVFAIIRVKDFHRTFSLFDNLVWDWKVYRLIIVQSLPLIVQFALSIITWEYFYILIEHHGARALAVSNTMRNIFGLFGVFAWSFAATANTMVSNIIGQGRQEEVVPVINKIMGVSVTISVLIFVALNLYPEWFLRFYGQGEDFVQYAIPVVRVVSFALVMMSVGTVWLNAVTGTGNSVVNLMIEIITLVIYIFYVYFVLEHWKMSITWGWASEWVYWFSMFLMAFFYIRSGKWKGKNI